MRRFLPFLLCVTVLLGACSKSVLPPAPVASYADAPKRELLASTLALPLQVSTAYLERQLSALIPKPIYEDNSLDDNGGDNLMLRVELREPVRLSAKGATLDIKLPLKVWAKAGYRVEKFGLSVGKYEETSFELDAGFLSTLSLLPTYKLRTQTAPNGYAWVKKPSIRLAGVEIPITAVVEKILDQQQAMVARLVDEQLAAKLDLKDQAQKIWRLVQEPILVNEEYRAWLTLTPRSLYAGPMQGSATSISLPLGLAVQARTTLGAKPAAAPLADVPALSLQNLPAEGFAINLLCQVPWEEARRLALAQLSGQVFEFEGGRKVQVTDLELYGQGKEMVIGASLTGSLDGKVYLRGTPVFESRTESVALAGADFDLKTSNRLAKVANWALHGKLQRRLQPYLAFSIAPQLKNGRDLIRKNLAQNALRPDIKLTGTLDTLAPGGLYVTPQGLEVDVTASGKVGVRME